MKELRAKANAIAGRNAHACGYLEEVLRELDEQVVRALDKGNDKAAEAYAAAFNLVEDRLTAIRRELCKRVK